jgi:hypothetical protein
MPASAASTSHGRAPPLKGGRIRIGEEVEGRGRGDMWDPRVSK